VVLSFDAHGDPNTPETIPSGTIHGAGTRRARLGESIVELPALQSDRIAVIRTR
jgi:arginase family enzyme